VLEHYLQAVQFKWSLWAGKQGAWRQDDRAVNMGRPWSGTLACKALEKRSHGEQLVPKYRTMYRPPQQHLAVVRSDTRRSWGVNDRGQRARTACHACSRGFNSGRLQRAIDRTSDEAKSRPLDHAAERRVARRSMKLATRWATQAADDGIADSASPWSIGQERPSTKSGTLCT
jgi:hypothetical protein